MASWKKLIVSGGIDASTDIASGTVPDARLPADCGANATYLTSVPNHSATLITSGTLPVARGGTGTTSGYNNSNWDSAYGWGNHASAGYLTSQTDSQTLTVNGTTLSISNGNQVTTQDTNTTYSAGTGLSLSTTTFSLASGSALTNLGGGSGSTFLKKDGTWATPTNTTYSNSSWTITSLSGFNSSTSNFLRGDGSWATPPDNNTTYSEATGSAEGLMSVAHHDKLDGIASSANNYSHPTSAGNKHIPSGGSSGQFLRYSASGTATWATPSYTTNTDTNTTYDMNIKSGSTKLNLYGSDSSNDLVEFVGSGATVVTRTDASTFTISSTDSNTTYSVGDGGLTQKNFTTTLKTKLDGVAASANNYGFTLSAEGGDDVAVASGDLLNIEGGSNVTVTRSGTDISIAASDNNTTYSAGSNMTLNGTTFAATNTTYSAGSGLDLSSTTFSVEADLRDGITHIGTDSGDYIGWTVNTHTDFYVNGNNEFRMEADGDFHADGDVIAMSTTVASDKRLKEDVVDLKNNLKKIMMLEPVRFDWAVKDKGEDIGLIAQDVQKVIPEIVKEVNTIGEISDYLDGDTMLTVDYAKLVPVLIGAIQELKEEIIELRS